MIEIGRLCMKTAGRDAGKKGVVVDVIDSLYVMLDGQVRRRKCSISHLEPLDKVIKIKKKAGHEEVVKAFKALKIDVPARKSKKPGPRPRKIRKAVQKKAEAEAKAAKPKKEEAKELKKPKPEVIEKPEVKKEAAKEVEKQVIKKPEVKKTKESGKKI